MARVKIEIYSANVLPFAQSEASIEVSRPTTRQAMADALAMALIQSGLDLEDLTERARRALRGADRPQPETRDAIPVEGPVGPPPAAVQRERTLRERMQDGERLKSPAPQPEGPAPDWLA